MMGILNIIVPGFQEGYPLVVFYAAGFIGIALLIFRPYWAFLFATFCLAGRNFNASVFTRTPQLGMYMNLNDLFLWISVLACFVTFLKKRTLWAPKVLIAILLINYFGAIESFFKYGFGGGVDRWLWASIIFPVMFLVGVNMVATRKDAYLFYWALFIGAIVATLQHFIFIRFMLPFMGTTVTGERVIRSVAFMMSGGIFLVIGSIFIRGKVMINSKLVYWFWLSGMLLITLSYFLSMTRTVYVGAVAGAIGVFIVILSHEGFSHFRYSIRIAVSALFIIVGIIIVSSILFPSVDLSTIADQRTQFLRKTDSFDEAYRTREQGFETEINLWLNTWVIWGEGTTLPPAYWEESAKNIGATYHVGLSTYLATFGILGLVVYWLWLPLATIKAGRTLYLAHKNDYVGALALAALALAFNDLATILSRNHYMMPMGQINGLIYGVVWGLARKQSLSKAPSHLFSANNRLVAQKTIG